MEKPTIRELEEILNDPSEADITIKPDGSIDVMPRDVVTLRARLTARAKTMLRARDVLVGIADDLDDEGDRVYFGSTNHAEMFKELTESFNEWAWSDIMGDAGGVDYIGECRRLRQQLEARSADSLDDALAVLEKARPGWGWSVSCYGSGISSCFLHRPDGEGCMHVEGKTPAAAVHNAIAKSDTRWTEEQDERRRAEREAKERADYERLKAKFDPPPNPHPQQGA